MEGSEDKIIPGENSSFSPSQKVIPGGQNATYGTSKVLPGEDAPLEKPGNNAPRPAPEASPTDIKQLIAMSTSKGGLQVIPPDFENKNGSWSSITSTNPFEILYLDYRQYKSITPEIVQNNHRIIAEFWADKLLIMNRGARDQIEKKYTAVVVTGAEKRLQAAFNKLKTTASLELTFQQVDEKRLTDGFAAIADLIDLSVQDGDITENKANVIITRGLKNGLESHEIERYIISVIQEKGFNPRAEKPDETRPFRNLWMTDVAWAAYQKRAIIRVEWLDEYASSLEELGDITFRKKEKSEYFLRDTNFLPPLVNKLTDSASRTAEFQRIIQEEKDAEKKYLKILYHLNPALPFRFRGEGFTEVDQLLEHACEKPESFWEAADFFSKDYLQIWLSESAPQVMMLAPEKRDAIGFLTFLYSVNRNYPFYLNNNKFLSPEDLARSMKTNQAMWVNVAQHMENGYLPVWFKAIGRSDINSRYNTHLESIIGSGLYDAKELKLAAAQTLILIIDSSVTVPTITADVKQITLPEVEGGSVVKSAVRLRIQNHAFVKATVKLDTQIEGITISESELTFNSYTHDSEREVVVTINSAQLIKDRPYSLNLLIQTSYGIVDIPIQIKVVFPKRAVTIKLAQYGAATALYFGLFRYLLSLLLNYDDWLVGYSYVTGNYPFLVFLLFAGFVSGGAYSYKLVKKLEKI
ncbi:hypothetical protein LXM25_16200 [Dyadobacter sp. LJ53]|uniref:hypothetical protein n=1 Tax=Dyadobacter chenwenxiniae TaxID=2906456 RepID=UPI001F1C83B0|nr:hypothetical protein [Dyadobacter chenwenxiniae]MCF0051611.1 hypothetical protein [Dyadobacter chenwenxiniae]